MTDLYLGALAILAVVFIVLFLIANTKNKKLLQKISSLEDSLKKVTIDKETLAQQVQSYADRFKDIIDIEEEKQRTKESFELQQQKSQHALELLTLKIKKLEEQYRDASTLYEKLQAENNILTNTLELAEFGVYEPHFELDISEEYKNKIKEVKERQKDLISYGNAVVCNTNWRVGDSQKQGEIMTKRAIKLTTRAFNGECDTLIAKVRWNNIEQYEKRIRKSFEMINKLNKSNDIHIQDEYLSCKIDELHLTHELELKKQEEKETQRRIREQMREEEKVRRELEKAQKEAEKEEKLLQQAMKKAQEQIAKSSELEREKYESELEELKQRLEEAEEKGQRAMSMAQQTKAGHVYVISNIGSFGEDVYKIGMTRRLEPLDRVKELGDASVPFKFDVHAMIYSENAPELENQLHKVFNDRRVNHVNLRREYFKLTLDEIEKVVVENHGVIEFVKIPEAKEYRESLAIRQRLFSAKEEDKLEPVYPTADNLFNID